MIADLKPYPAYKDSALPWLGQIPERWEIRRNGRLFTQRNETGFPDLPILEVSLKTGVRVRDFESSNRKQMMSEREKYKRACRGDIAYNMMRMWQGAVGVSPVDGLVSPAYVVAKPLPETDARYFQRLFRIPSYMGEVNAFSRGIVSDRNRLYWEDFKRIPSPFPPAEEQAAIVSFIDYVDRRIRRYIRAKQKLIKLLEEQKQAIIHRAVTRGLDPDVRLKPSGVEWLGEVPEHWEVRRAKTVCSALIDCKNRTPDHVEEGGYSVVRTTCIRAGSFDPSGGYETDLKNFLAWTARGAPQTGDVFFTREAPAGEACLVPDREDLCMGQRMMYFRPDPALLDSRFLLLNIYGPLTRTYVELATNGSTVGHLRLGQVYALPILWCPIEEQNAIVQYVDKETASLERTRSVAQREIDLLREYRTRLIADVVTGKLDVREAASRLPEEETEELEDPDDQPELAEHPDETDLIDSPEAEA